MRGTVAKHLKWLARYKRGNYYDELKRELHAGEIRMENHKAVQVDRVIRDRRTPRQIKRGRIARHGRRPATNQQLRKAAR